MSYGYILVDREGNPVETKVYGIKSLPYFETEKNAAAFACAPEVRVKQTLLGGWKKLFGERLINWEGRVPAI